MTERTAPEVWSKLQTKRDIVLRKARELARLTTPQLYDPEGQDPDMIERANGMQSLGAMCVGHIVNRYARTMFSPGFSFIKLKLTAAIQKTLLDQGMDPPAIDAATAVLEREACAEVDVAGIRPKLVSVLHHLVVAGNCAYKLTPKGSDEYGDEIGGALRVFGLKHFVIQRCAEGRMLRAVIREQLPFIELSENVRAAEIDGKPIAKQYQEDTKVYLYLMLERRGRFIYASQWVNKQRLPEEFDGKWSIGTCPWHFPVWNLADDADYGNGLCEEHWRDLLALETLSGALVDGCVLAADMTWVLNPNGQTKAADLRTGIRGKVIPGRKEDLAAVHAGTGLPQSLDVLLKVADVYEKRLNHGFLRLVGMTRTAERVTATEIRRDAMELETGHAGRYSALAPQLQLPVARWGLKRQGAGINGIKDATVTVITGLDALSRHGELESYREAVQDMQLLATLPAPMQQDLSFRRILQFVSSRHGLDVSQFFLTPEEKAAQNQLMAEQAQSQTDASVPTQDKTGGV